jgi:hypothetical protein
LWALLHSVVNTVINSVLYISKTVKKVSFKCSHHT